MSKCIYSKNVLSTLSRVNLCSLLGKRVKVICTGGMEHFTFIAFIIIIIRSNFYNPLKCDTFPNSFHVPRRICIVTSIVTYECKGLTRTCAQPRTFSGSMGSTTTGLSWKWKGQATNDPPRSAANKCVIRPDAILENIKPDRAEYQCIVVTKVIDGLSYGTHRFRNSHCFPRDFSKRRGER